MVLRGNCGWNIIYTSHISHHQAAWPGALQTQDPAERQDNTFLKRNTFFYHQNNSYSSLAMSQICPRPDLKYQHVVNTEQPCWTALICASVWQSDSLCDTNQRRINKWSVRYLVVPVVCPVSRQCDLRWGALQLKWLISCVGPDLSDLYWAFLARLIFSISLHIYNVIMDFERRKK